ncbi:MAG: twin-arginine translocase TatA/TatE family subunit [Planctomycetota bacterium]
MFSFGVWQFAILLLIVLLLFGTRLPSVARSLGLSITEFKKGIKGIDDKSNSSSEDKS